MHPAGTFAVGLADRTYVDTSRPTAAHGGKPELPSRTLHTSVLYPAQGTPSAAGTPQRDAPAQAGSWPVIVFAHGSTRAGLDYVATLSWWVSAGYIVVAPNFPLSTTGVPGGTAYLDYPAQTADESFVLDSVFADDAAPLHLASLVDHRRVGLGGQSFGAITTLGTVAAACCADERVKAATEFAGMWLPYSSGADLSPHASKVAVLFVHGDADPTVPYANDHAFWKKLRAPGGFLTLVGGMHDDGYFEGGAKPLDRFVAQATLAFYDEHLKDDRAAGARFAKLVADVGPKVATFEPTPAPPASAASS